jgi:hypothetical protein
VACLSPANRWYLALDGLNQSQPAKAGDILKIQLFEKPG